jgi:uncharacterized membrane protein YoaT (DUF817 family)
MGDRHSWATAFLREVLTMPRRHVVVFLLATILLIIVDVEVVEEWHPIRLFELIGLMLFVYMGWVTWRVARMLRKQGKL